jgi:hypothetical protein
MNGVVRRLPVKGADGSIDLIESTWVWHLGIHYLPQADEYGLMLRYN